MNYKNIMLIALALCLCITMPVAAVWQNGNWIEDTNAPSVQYDPVTGVSSKYVPLVEEKDIMAYTGLVYGNLKSGQVLNGGERFLISNDLSPNVTKEFYFNKDGLFDDYFIEGNFTATLPQGTGSATGIDGSGNAHPEVAHFRVVAGQTSYFTFIGNSAASLPADESKDRVITIIKAEYCGETIPAVTHTVHHEAYYTVVSADYIPGHWEGWYYVPGHFNGNCDKTSGSHYDFKIGNQKYRFEHNGEYTYTLHPAYNEVVIDTPAIIGGCTDVTQNVQDVVNMGITTFKFDNAPTVGGIFSLGNDLLSEITDPAPGIVKSVSIQYTIDGAENNINMMERQPITFI